MGHGWGSGRRTGVGRRAVVGAGAALVLLAPGGAAFADDPTSGVPAPVGTLVVREMPDGGLTIDFASAEPVEGLPTGVVIDPPVMPSRPTPDDASALPWDLLPLVLGTTPPPVVVPPVAAHAATVASAPGRPAAVPSPAPIARALDPVVLALGSDPAQPAPEEPAATPAPASPAGPSPAAGPVDVSMRPAGTPGPGLASTGTPIAAALAGLVLLAVGGFLTWARGRR